MNTIEDTSVNANKEQTGKFLFLNWLLKMFFARMAKDIFKSQFKNRRFHPKASMFVCIMDVIWILCWYFTLFWIPVSADDLCVCITSMDN